MCLRRGPPGLGLHESPSTALTGARGPSPTVTQRDEPNTVSHRPVQPRP